MDGWRRVGAQIERERTRRWPTRIEFAHATGLSVRVLIDLEGGRRSRYRVSTLTAVEGALGLPPGEIIAAAETGRKLRHMRDPELARIMRAWPRLSRDARVMLAGVAESVLG